jgi:undecaprenyl diphosphate synthase
MNFSRLPRHIGIIPDGNRRWADARGLERAAGYGCGVEPGFRLLGAARALGIEEISVYGFTKENVRRAPAQVAAFRVACTEAALRLVDEGAAVLAVGDTASPAFPRPLLPLARARSPGDIKINLLVNYGWRWDLFGARGARVRRTTTRPSPHSGLGSVGVSRIDLVMRWGGRRRLSGFLPVQCAYADIYVVDTLWPEAQVEEFFDGLRWYQEQDVTIGG